MRKMPTKSVLVMQRAEKFRLFIAFPQKDEEKSEQNNIFNVKCLEVVFLGCALAGNFSFARLAYTMLLMADHKFQLELMAR